MNNSLDRQGILDRLTVYETTAKLLVNSFVTKKSDTAEICLNGIDREELIAQTTTFLSRAQELIVNLSNTFNLTIDGFVEKKVKTESNGQLNSKSSICDASHYNEDHGPDCKPAPSDKKIYSLSSVTLEDIIQNRLSPANLLSNYPLLHDSIPPNLTSLARSLRQIENLDDLTLKAYSKVFNHEERLCCNYDGTNGKLPYPRHKRLLFDLMIRLTLNERDKTLNDDERHHFYIQCEKHSLTETSLAKYRGVNTSHLNEYDEKEFVYSLFRSVIPQDDIQRIITAKQDLSSQWNDNEMCIYYARPIHLLWIKQKWLERYPLNGDNEIERWSQCIDWVIDSLLDKTKVRPSKRKTMDTSADHKRTKNSLTLQEKINQIDRTKFNALEYATELLQYLSKENNQTLPTFEQLQLLKSHLMRFYWIPNEEQTWSHILDMIKNVFMNESTDDFRQFYAKQLLEMNQNNQMEIEQLLQIAL